MATRTVSRTRVVPRSSVAGKLMQYLSLGATEKDVKKRRDDIKKELLAFTEANHVVDEEKGHLLHTLPEAVDFLGQRFLGFMKQRKVSQVFLDDKAEALCTKKGLDEDEFISYERYVDQDKIARLYAEDKISKKEFDSLFEENESWAFVPVKE